MRVRTDAHTHAVALCSVGTNQINEQNKTKNDASSRVYLILTNYDSFLWNTVFSPKKRKISPSSRERALFVFFFQHQSNV
jgi:hypothetical protein